VGDLVVIRGCIWLHKLAFVMATRKFLTQDVIWSVLLLDVSGYELRAVRTVHLQLKNHRDTKIYCRSFWVRALIQNIKFNILYYFSLDSREESSLLFYIWSSMAAA
jgi:hypothetical protein